MDYQVAFNAILGLAIALGMWIMNSLSSKIERLDKDVRDVPDKYLRKHDFEVGVAGLKTDMRAMQAEMSKGFERIYDKLDGKEDKSASIGSRRD